MPNQPKTPHLTIRCPTELRDAARLAAQHNGETLTAVVLRALADYVERTANERHSANMRAALDQINPEWTARLAMPTNKGESVSIYDDVMRAYRSATNA